VRLPISVVRANNALITRTTMLMTGLLAIERVRREWQKPGLIADTETGVGFGNREASSRTNMTSST